MKRQSRRFLLNLRDLAKGLVTAALGAAATTIQQSYVNWNDLSQIDTHAIINVAVMAGIGYLTKNWLTNSKGEILTTQKP